MKEVSPKLKKFERRVRLVRSWRGLAVGMCVGGILAAGWAVLDWRGILYTNWPSLAALVIGSGLIGGIIGALWRVPAQALADSIDRRACLEDRLTTTINTKGEGAFEEALRQDTETHLAEVRPAQVFPVRVGRWQGGALALTAVAASIFLLGNTPILLSGEARAEREELQKKAPAIERIARPMEQSRRTDELTEEERRLAAEMRKFQRELERARLDRTETLQKANDLAKKADELAKKRLEMSEQSLQKAQNAFDRLKQEQMQREISRLDPHARLDEQLAKLSESERSRMESDLQGKIDSLKKQMSELSQRLKDGKQGDESKEQLSSTLRELEKQLEGAKKALYQLKLSEEALKSLQKMMEDPIWREIQEAAAKLQAANEDAEGGESPQLTKEELEEMRRKLEEFAEQMKDDDARREYLEMLLDAIKNAEALGQCRGACISIAGLFGIPMPSASGSGGKSKDDFFMNTGKVNKHDTPQESKGKTTPTMIRGARKEENLGEENYIEIKAPTSVGTRTSVPYKNVLPSYRKRAEAAMNRKEIPKEHQKRVREYFDSLGKG